MKLDEIAAKISAHLKRFEASKKHNPLDKKFGTRRYYNASAYASGSRVYVVYINYQGASGLKKADALKYLAWLDAKNIGRWSECPGIVWRDVSYRSR